MGTRKDARSAPAVKVTTTLESWQQDPSGPAVRETKGLARLLPPARSLPSEGPINTLIPPERGAAGCTQHENHSSAFLLRAQSPTALLIHIFLLIPMTLAPIYTICLHIVTGDQPMESDPCQPQHSEV